MFDLFRLKDALVNYREVFFSKRWPEEKFKWEAAKCFQDNWDVNAPNFAEMLAQALSKTNGLLASINNFPAKMILSFAKVAPEEVRSMFIALFNENEDVVTRILDFKNQSSILLEKYGNGAGQHYQYENAVSTYLWLRYPDKYFIYKYGEVKAVADELGSDCHFKKGAYADNLRNFFALYNEIRSELAKDLKLVRLLNDHLSDTCYPDSRLCTLTIDVAFFISRVYKLQRPVDPTDYEWWPVDYSPALSIDDWTALLGDPSVFNKSSLEIMKRMQDYGGEATCKQLSVKYGETPQFYITGSAALAKRVAEKTECPVMPRDDETYRWWPILYVGKDASKDEEGPFVWKLRDELAKALELVDLSQVSLFAQASPGEECRYWMLNANPKIWSFSNIAVGEVQSYTLYNDNGNKRRIFQNFLDAKAGDMVIGYESTPVKQIVAIGKISAEQDGEKIYFEKVEGLSSPIDYAALRACPELSKMEYFSMQQGSLFKLTKGEYEFIVDLIREENPAPTSAAAVGKYDKVAFLDEVYMSESRYDTLVAVLRNKKNIILQGAPGVGKTFAAKRLAYSIMGEKDESRIEFVQFHQNYSYEDFMMGYKPENDGFELKYGIFYRFCQKAANQPEKDFFFVIDEINRGNMSKIFGELLMLIERDYRGTKATLAYNGLAFAVPQNLYIIGMMNTADRSLAMIDYALRRRFSFFDIEPGFESDGFRRYQNQLDNETFSLLISKIQELNKEITLDKSLGKGFCIGHSYFCGQTECTEAWMQAIIDFDILPMLSEYWFDDANKLKRWENILRGVFQ